MCFPPDTKYLILILWYNYGTIVPKGAVALPHIIPIRDLKDTGRISQLCHSTDDPIFITKNGYGDMVIMSMEAYERELYLMDMERKLKASEKAIEEGKVRDGWEVLDRLKKEYDV